MNNTPRDSMTRWNTRNSHSLPCPRPCTAACASLTLWCRYVELITCAEFHPQSCNIMIHSNSSGHIKMNDLRQAIHSQFIPLDACCLEFPSSTPVEDLCVSFRVRSLTKLQLENSSSSASRRPARCSPRQGLLRACVSLLHDAASCPTAPFIDGPSLGRCCPHRLCPM